MDRAQRRHKLKGAWSRGEKCLGNCALCCVAIGFLRKNASKRFTPRWLQVSCGVRVAGFRRQKPSSSYLFRKTGGFVPVGGLVSHNKTLSAGVKMQIEPSVLVAQSAGSCVWMGRACGSERRLTSWTCCDSVAKCGMVGDHEKCRGWLLGPDSAASQEKLGSQF